MNKVEIVIGGVNIEMDKEEISKAIETGKVELKADDLVLYKSDEFETFKTNLANDEYKKGKTAGEEMLIKTAKERNGLEFEGKSFDKYDEALKAKVISEANIKPNEQIEKLQGDLKTLQTNYSTLETEYNGFKSTITEKEARFKRDSSLLSFMPDNLVVDKDIALMALKTKAGLDVDENGFALINGQPTQDKLMQNIPLSTDIINDKLNVLGLLKKKEGGNGGYDEPGGKTASSYDKFVKEMGNNDISEGSEKFQIEMNKRLSEKTLTM